MSTPRVKVLYRTSKLGPTTRISMVPNLDMDPPVKYGATSSFFDNIGSKIGSFFPHRKSASGEPLTIAQRISEFIHFNKPNISLDMDSFIATLQRLKVPGLAILGVAFVAGVAYLAYRLYKNWNEKKAAETVNKIMKDFEESTPELLQLPGWYEQVKNEVVAAVNSGSDTQMVELIAKIKTALVEKQQSMGKQVGSGIDLFEDHIPIRRRYHGAGVIMPL